MELKRRKKGPLVHTDTEFEYISDPGVIDDHSLRIDTTPAYHSDSQSMFCGGHDSRGNLTERVIMADTSAQQTRIVFEAVMEHHP